MTLLSAPFVLGEPALVSAIGDVAVQMQLVLRGLTRAPDALSLEGASRSAPGKVALPRGGESEEASDSLLRRPPGARLTGGSPASRGRASFRGRPRKLARGRAGGGRRRSGLAHFVKALESSPFQQILFCTFGAGGTRTGERRRSALKNFLGIRFLCCRMFLKF